MTSVPDKNRPEWKELVSGKSSHTFANFVLQMKLNQVIENTSKGELDMDQAVEELFELCIRYEKAVKTDLEKIFNTNQEMPKQ